MVITLSHEKSKFSRYSEIDTPQDPCYRFSMNCITWHIDAGTNLPKLSIQSMELAIDIINLVKELKLKKESIISNQLGKSATSIGANIREAHYAHGMADFIEKLQIALKESNETGYWLELLYKTNYIDESLYKNLDSKCASIRIMLISSINTAKNNQN